MKKIFILLIAAVIFSSGYTQPPSASITVENPRIVGSNYYIDIYFMRTNDAEQWYPANNPGSGTACYVQSSWVFEVNNPAFSSGSVVYEDPTFIQGNYLSTVAIEPGPGNVNVTSNFTGTILPHFPLDQWIHAYTVELVIASTVVNSGISWDELATGLIGAGFGSTSVNETHFDSDCDIALNTNCWTGAQNGAWENGNNWSNGVMPTSSDNIIYPYGANIEMTTNNGAHGITNDLRVNHKARLQIAFNEGITVTGDIELKGDTNFHLQGQSGLGTLSSFLIAEGNINYNGYTLEPGHIRVDRTLWYENTGADYYHHQVAAPVDNATLDDWDMQHEYSYAYEFAADQSWFNIYNPARPTGPGYGFILSLYGSSGFETSTQNILFVDNLVTSTVNPAITPGSGNYSLIGNPYTAPIHWDVMEGLSTNMVDAVWVWDPDGGSYAAYNTVGGGDASAQYIQPGQAFFVEASGLAPTFSITPGARIDNIQPYLKSSKANGLTLFTEGGNYTHDKTYITFIDSELASGNYEESIDVLEWPSSYGDQATELYTVSSDDQNLIIDVRPLSPDLMSVPLSFKAAVEAEYTLGADLESLESFSVGTEISLEDTHHPELGWIDLREFNTYTFNASPEDEYNRFMIHFHIKDFGINELSESPIYIYSDRTDAIIKNNSGQLIKEIHIFDVTGNLMTVKSGVNDDITRMFVSSNSGYYVVKVITDKAVYSEKVLITK